MARSSRSRLPDADASSRQHITSSADNCGSCCEEESWFVVGLNPLRYAAVVASKRCNSLRSLFIIPVFVFPQGRYGAAVYEWLTYFQFSSSLVNGSAPPAVDSERCRALARAAASLAAAPPLVITPSLERSPVGDGRVALIQMRRRLTRARRHERFERGGDNERAGRRWVEVPRWVVHLVRVS